jgi:hypothetical protein
MTVEEPLLFESKVWKTVSTDGKDLIVKLLIKNPNKRLTLD